MTMTRVATLIAGVLAALSGCAGDAQVSTRPEPSESTERSPSVAPSHTGVHVTVPSHCGVLSVTIDGHLWLADPPLGHHNPPPGWNENETTGYFVRTGPQRAEFHGDGGQHAHFRRAASGAEDPNTGCE